MLAVLKACSKDKLRQLSLGFVRPSTLEQQMECAVEITAAGICCEKLDLRFCHVNAIPSFIRPHQENLEHILLSAIRRNTMEQRLAQLNVRAEETHFPKLRGLDIDGYVTFHEEITRGISLGIAQQIKHLRCRSDFQLGPDSPEATSRFFKQCSFSQLESLDSVFIEHSDLCAILASAVRLKRIHVYVMNTLEKEKSILPSLPLTLEHFEIGHLSFSLDPPETILPFVRSLKHLAACPEITYEEESREDEENQEHGSGEQKARRTRVDVARDQLVAYLRSRDIACSDGEIKKLMHIHVEESVKWDSEGDD